MHILLFNNGHKLTIDLQKYNINYFCIQSNNMIALCLIRKYDAQKCLCLCVCGGGGGGGGGVVAWDLKTFDRTLYLLFYQVYL